ncbi:MAG: poly(3-hydroxybutyrate) depolymerase [Verrucomicrobiales bacterium]|jgi:poly(3-hydroxybutyrate) depolymerase
MSLMIAFLKPLLAVIAAFFAVAGSALAVDFDQSTGDLLYDDGAGNSLPYRLFLPEGYNENDQYPLVLYLHGAGERGVDNKFQANGGGHMENLYRATQGSTFGGQYKALLLAPQCPTSDQWVNWPWARGAFTQNEEPAEGQSMHSALAILDRVIADYPVNSDQVYVTGLSMGGFGTWDALRRRPGLFAAAMPLSGGGNKEQGTFFRSIPIWAYHGSSDGVVPVKGTDEIRDSIAAAGGFIEYTRIPTGHTGWSTFYNNKTYSNSANQTVYEWLFSQTLKGPLAPFTITSLQTSNSAEGRQATLIWNSRISRTYVIQMMKDDQGEWSDMPFSVETAGLATTVTFNNPADVNAGYFRVREGLPSADLLSNSIVHWLVPNDESLIATWNATTPPDLPDGAEFAVGSGLGIGFETNPGAFDPLIDTPVLDAMLAKNASIYLRYVFTIPANQDFTTLELGMRYDDGFVAFLNGTEIASRNAPEVVTWDSDAFTIHSDSKAVEFEDIDLTEFIELLLPGQDNVLAIQGMNKTAGGSDFLIFPRLTGEFNTVAIEE